MKKTVFILIALVLTVGASYSALKNKETHVLKTENIPQAEEYITYKSSEYSPEFTYPKSWGDVSIIEGNKVCPEEDSYRTSDSMHVYDFEYAFPERKLPGSDSMIRSGIRLREIDLKKPNDCGDDFLIKIYTKEVDPQTISSFMLNAVINRAGLEGIYNREASRLNTEARMQYTFFVPREAGIQVLQAYMSFIPYFDSPELKEMEGRFSGDMMRYLEEGETSNILRHNFNEFGLMVESLNFSVE